MKKEVEIKELLGLVEELWNKYPHLQFNQLVNIMRNRYETYGRKYVDFSEVNDEEFNDFLKHELK